MTEAYAILCELQARGIDVSTRGDKIVVTPSELMTDDLRARVRACRDDVLEILRRELVPPPSRYSREFAGLLSRVTDAKKRAELRARFEARACVLCWSRALPTDEGDRLALESLRGEVEAGRLAPPPHRGV